MTAVLALVVAAVHEEVDRHGNHREDAGGEHGDDAGQQGTEEETQERFLGCGLLGGGLGGLGGRGGGLHGIRRGLFGGDGFRLGGGRVNGIRDSGFHLDGEGHIVGGDAAAVVAELSVLRLIFWRKTTVPSKERTVQPKSLS